MEAFVVATISRTYNHLTSFLLFLSLYYPLVHSSTSSHILHSHQHDNQRVSSLPALNVLLSHCQGNSTTAANRSSSANTFSLSLSHSFCLYTSESSRSIPSLFIPLPNLSAFHYFIHSLHPFLSFFLSTTHPNPRFSFIFFL